MKKRLCVLLLLPLVLLVVSCAQPDSLMDTVYYQHSIDTWAESLKAQEPEIAFYGDSRVADVDWRNAFSDSKVVNLGVGGDKIGNLIRRLPLLDALEIKVCFLSIGGNDCLSSAFSRTTFEYEYAMLLSALQERGIAVYAHTIAGITTAHATYDEKTVRKSNEKITLGNEIINRLAPGYGMHVIDIATLLNNPDGSLEAGYSLDGAHFTQAGNEAWINTLRPIIDSL